MDPAGVEPATYGVQYRCSTALSYRPVCRRATAVGWVRDPSATAAACGDRVESRGMALRGPDLLLLDYSVFKVHRSSTPPRDAGSWPGGARTPNRWFWRPVLYQLSYGPMTV